MQININKRLIRTYVWRVKVYDTDRRKLYGKYDPGNLGNTMSAVNGNDKLDGGE